MTGIETTKLTCLCGAVREEGSLLKAREFPVPSFACHCNSCRHSTGGLFATPVGLQGRPSEPNLANCTSYNSSARLNRYFCKSCGCHCFVEIIAEDRWYAYSGIIDQPLRDSGKEPVNTLKIQRHIFVADTLDYALPSRLLSIDDKDIPCYTTGVLENPLSKDDISQTRQIQHDKNAEGRNDFLEARCHCGNVEFCIDRPSWEDCKHQQIIPPEEHKDKYTANLCACRSCRMTTGSSSLTPWMFVPRQELLTSGGKAVHLGPDRPSFSGMTVIWTTPGKVMRCFCATCGATVSYWTSERPETVDIAVGLLKAPEGSAAGSWLYALLDEVGFKDEARDTATVVELGR